MDKILVEIFLPAANVCYDVYLPVELSIAQTIKLIIMMVRELTQGTYIPGANSVLCDYDTGHILNINILVLESGLHNGSKLILI